MTSPTASTDTPTNDQGTVRLTRDGAVAYLTFDRPQARNAMTWAMYQDLAAACDEIMEDASVRVAVFRGAGGKAFVAGTDIAQFKEFSSGDDGLAYEDKVETYIERVENCPCRPYAWSKAGPWAAAWPSPTPAISASPRRDRGSACRSHAPCRRRTA